MDESTLAHTYNGVRGMVNIVNPLADAGREKALCTAMVLGHQSLVLFHGNKQCSGRPKRKEMVNLREAKTSD